jgi:hypothetical protein
VAAALRGGDFKKREFETTEQFKARLKPKLEAAGDLAAKTGQQKLIFSLPLINTFYDADKRIMKFGSEFLSVVGGRTLAGFIISSNHKVTGTYVGSNAFGVQKVIEKVEGDEIRLKIETEDSLSLTWPPRFKPFQISMDAARAQSIKNNGAVMVAAQLTPPYFSNTVNYYTPKIDSPWDKTIRAEIVHVKAKCAAIVDRSTNELVRYLDVSPPATAIPATAIRNSTTLRSPPDRRHKPEVRSAPPT